jgi:hypothetical protein
MQRRKFVRGMELIMHAGTLSGHYGRRLQGAGRRAQTAGDGYLLGS